MPALPPYIIEPIWEQLAALLPKREINHPLGCHRPRVPDRVVFEKLVQVLVFGRAYHRIADESWATTLRERRDEWIELGVIDAVREAVLEAYDRFIGLDLSEVAVDCCITKVPCGGEVAGRSPVDRSKRGIKRSTAVDAEGIPIGTVTDSASRYDSPLLAPTLEHACGSVGGLPEEASVHLDRGYDSKTTRQRKGQALTAWGNEALGSGDARSTITLAGVRKGIECLLEKTLSSLTTASALSAKYSRSVSYSPSPSDVTPLSNRSARGSDPFGETGTPSATNTLSNSKASS